MPTTRTAEALRFEAMAREHLERLGQRIRERREELGLTQGQVAREMPNAVDSTAVSRWERGQHKPSDDYLDRLAEILKTTPVKLLFDESERTDGTPDPFGDAGLSQLDRIEAKLDRLLEAIGVIVEANTELAGRDALRALVRHDVGLLDTAARENGVADESRDESDATPAAPPAQSAGTQSDA